MSCPSVLSILFLCVWTVLVTDCLATIVNDLNLSVSNQSCLHGPRSPATSYPLGSKPSRIFSIFGISLLCCSARPIADTTENRHRTFSRRLRKQQRPRYQTIQPCLQSRNTLLLLSTFPQRPDGIRIHKRDLGVCERGRNGLRAFKG